MSTWICEIDSGCDLRGAQGCARLSPAMTLLTQIRKSRGLSLDKVARAVSTDPTNLSRVEKGVQTPKRDLARALYEFYDGVVDLGAIYDPEFFGQIQPAVRRR